MKRTKKQKKKKNVDEDKEKLKQNDLIETDDLKICNREELIKFLKLKVSSIETKQSYNIGFVGFPNVGKSSVINVIMDEKKVGVASMPGKTKHYQTLFLNNDKAFCLVDCPGLVFPSFTKK